MASKKQQEFERINAKFGIETKSQNISTGKNNGRQSNNSAPVTRSNNSAGNTKQQQAFEKINAEFGIEEKRQNISMQPVATNDFIKSTTDAFANAKKHANSKATITSHLSDNERNSRIKEIETELKQLNYTIDGLGRAGSYGGNTGQLKVKSDEAKKRKAELSEELKTLKRVGTFTASELKQFEIDDAKAEKTKLGVINPTARVSPQNAKAHAEKVQAAYDTQKKIDTLERQKDLYDDIFNFGDVVNKDDFGGQWRANYRSNELSREADKAMSEYIRNPTEENKQIAYAYDAFAKEYAKNNEKALDDENVKASWLTKSTAGYLPQFRDTIVPELIGGGIGYVFGGQIGSTIGAGMASYAQSYDAIRGSVYRTLLAEGVDEKTALEAAEDEAFISSLIEGGETAIGWLLSGGGKALSAIGNAAKASVAKGSTNAATKFVADIASKAAKNSVNKAAAKAVKEISRPLWNKGLRMAGGIVGNALSEYGEEFAQGAVSIANREKALQDYETITPNDNLWSGGAKVIGSALSGNNPEAFAELHEQGKEGFKIGLMFGGSQTIANNVISQYFNAKTVKLQNEVADTIVKDEESLNALIEEGKASGEGTVSAKLAEEIEQAKENGTVTREQVKQLIESNEVYIKNEKKSGVGENAIKTSTAGVVKILENMNEARKAFVKYAKENFPKSVINAETQKDIAISRTGIDKFLSGNISKEKYATGKEIPALIESATKVGEAENKKGKSGIVGYEYFRNSIKIDDVDYAVHIRVRNTNMGDKYYGHTISREVEEIKIEPMAWNSDKQSGHPINAAGSTNNIPQSSGVVNTVGTPLVEKLNVLSANNEAITVEDAKRASGFGENGAKLLTDIVNKSSGATFSKVSDAMRNAYEAGRVGLDGKKLNFQTNLQIDAFTAGKMDYELSRQALEQKANFATVHGKESGFIHNEFSKNVALEMVTALNTVSKALGIKTMFVERINAEGTNNEANAVMGEDGIFRISAASEQPLYELIIHEPFHRMRQLATPEYFTAMRYAVEHAEQLGIRLANGNSKGTYFEALTNLYEGKGLSHDDTKILDEIGARFFQKLCSSDAEAIALINEMNQNEETRGALAKVMDFAKELIAKLKKLWDKLVKNGDTKTANQVKGTISDLEAARKVYLDALNATAKKVEKITAERGSKDVATNATTNGGESYLLKGDTEITSDDVKVIQSIGRKSINSFTTEDIKKTEKFAKRMWKELGTKSPFFRAWFGDWRVNDHKTKVDIIEVTEKIIPDNTAPKNIGILLRTKLKNKELFRGDVINADTSYKIQIGAFGYNDTLTYAQRELRKKGISSEEAFRRINALSKIDELIQDAVLLDTEVIVDEDNPNRSFMHSFYTVAKVGGVDELIKIKVDELESPTNPTKRFYNLNDFEIINKKPLAVNWDLNPSTDANGSKGIASANISVSDLFNLVKSLDENFNPKSASAIVDEEGEPLMVYHGTDKKFTAFDISKGRANMDIQGSFFSPWELDAKGYGSNVGKYYLSIKNPADGATAYAALNRFKGQNNAGVKAREYLIKQEYDGVNFYDEEYVAFYPTQIKSATDNIGTFDNDNPEVDFSLKDNIVVSEKETKNLAIEANEGYNGDSYSLKWHTDLTPSQVEMVEGWLEREDDPEDKRITDTASWYMGRLNGDSLFVIYSREDKDGKTILYESKGKKARLEHNILMSVMEVYKNGESVIGRTRRINWLLGGNWMQRKHNVANSNVGSREGRSGVGDVTVLQGKSSQFIGSKAFRNVIKNLFEIQGRDRGLNKRESHSLKDNIVVSEKETIRFLDTLEQLKRGEVDPSDALSKYVDSGRISAKDYDNLVKMYGSIPSGEKPHRDVQVPKKTADGKKVSQTVRTILEAKATPDTSIPTIEKMVEDGIFSYDVYTDKQAINDANETIGKYGWEKSLRDWLDDVNKGNVSKKITAMGWALYNNAANTAATTTSKTERDTAVRTSLEILNAMVQHQRSAAQALQATRILKKLSPETQLYGVSQSVQALQKELENKYGDKAPNLKINGRLAEKFLNAKTEDERLAAEREIYKDIGRQMPSNWLDKWNAWRYIAMLTNLRTHGRNIVGNAAFAPVVLAKNLTATAIEAVVNRVSGKKILRGKALVWGSKADRALLKAAWADYSNVADMISNGGKYNDSANANRYIEEGRRIFKNKLLEGTRRGNSWLLEVEDMWFSMPHYAYALAQYCKANNITPEQIKRGMAIAPAREYAVKEAQKATYKDTNAFSQMISGLGRTGNSKNAVEKAGRTVIEGALPFRKAPANILVRGVEYSPLGLLKGLSYDLVQVSKGNMTASEAIDHISAGLTGTGLLALGILLAAQGLVRGHGGEDDEKEFEELMGHQAYSLELPNGQSATLDWLAPEALPFFVGVNIWESTRGSGEKVNLSTILSAVSNISEPMLEMSCLQSLNVLFEGIRYARSQDMSGLASILSSAETSYLTQGIPTLLGQAERTGEENRMTTYTEKNDFLTGDMQYTVGKISAKIPFWDYKQIPYIDAWGRKEASETALKRGFNNFLNPAYTSTIETSKMEKELMRLYERTGDDAVFPSRANKYFTVDGVRKDLTGEEYVRYATLKGKKSYDLVTKLVQSKDYKDLDNAGKVKAIDEAYTYADQKAKQAVSRYKPETWVNSADELGSNVEDYITFRANVSKTKKDNGNKLSKTDVVNIISKMDIDNDDVWTLYLSQYDDKSAQYARSNGIDGKTYMDFLEALSEVDKPSKSGKYGSYTQEEARNAASRFDKSLRRRLYQSVNPDWKANPYR